MVQAGQFLERMTVVDSGDAHLEALYHRGERPRPVVLVGGHPALGGNMEGPVVTELAWALSQTGFSTLRFNFPGVGASPGRPHVDALLPEELAASLTATTLKHYVDDVLNVVRRQSENADDAGCHLVGYSFGAAVVFNAALTGVERDDVRIESVALVSPPVSVLPQAFSTADPIVDAGMGLQILTGAADEHAPAAAIGDVLGPHVYVRAFKDADHRFTRGLSDLGREVAARLR